jgi:hypothetical protein
VENLGHSMVAVGLSVVPERRFPPPPPPVRKIETRGRVFLAAPRTRAVTALPERAPHSLELAGPSPTLPYLSPAASRRPGPLALLRTEALPQDHTRPELTEEERYAVADHAVAQLKERGDPWRLNEDATPTTGLPST